MQRQYVERTKREKELDKKRKGVRDAQLSWEAVPGAVKFGTDEMNHKALVGAVKHLIDNGIRAFRFVRQVPATPSYPKGVSSTQWLDLKSYSPKRLSNFIGSMMTPGVDYVRNMMILDDDIPKLPEPLRSRAMAAIRKR